MRSRGFDVVAQEVGDLTALKERYQVPPELRSCHTAIVDGYVVEGHVPAEEVRRLLDERPDIVGVAVAGMPLGSPGMEAGGEATEPYEVVAFDETGPVEIFASYP